jgi:D-glycero-alpha-D-manno-heptose-7-phosphate kinase
MIITQTPLRISFAGGGSDLPAFYKQEPGCVLSASINKYIFIAAHPYFYGNKIQLKYAKTELVDNVCDIQHPIFRQVLSDLKMNGLDLNSIADIPAGTGLGSSSSFTVGLLHTLKAYLGRYCSAEELAAEACDIEINKLGEPIGKQDQYAAAYGGLNLITFYPDETVNVEKIIIGQDQKKELEKNLIMIFTGSSRSASSILKEQGQITISEKSKYNSVRQMAALARELRSVLSGASFDDFGRILHEGWLLKKSLTSSISNSGINDIYEKGIKSGALGGKLLGAGGSGFILFYCPYESQPAFRQTMSGYRELGFKFDNWGSKVIYVGEQDEVEENRKG